MTLENAKRLFEFYKSTNQEARANAVLEKHPELEEKKEIKKVSKKESEDGKESE